MSDMKEARSSDLPLADMEVDKARSEAIFRFTVPNISSLEEDDVVLSPTCYVRNLPWRVKVIVMRKDKKKYLKFFLKCYGVQSSWSCYVNASLSIVVSELLSRLFSKRIHKLFSSKGKNTCGVFGSDTEWNDIFNPEKKFIIKDDSITFEVHITAEASHIVSWKSNNFKNCPDWQLQCRNIMQQRAHLLKSQEWSDCSFVVGELPDTIATIKAHKLILAMASPVFEAMFYGPIAESNNPIQIPDVHPNTFQKMMKFIYTGNVELYSIDIAIELYYVGQKYMLANLLPVCSDYLFSKISPDVVCIIYEFAATVGEKNLILRCEEVIQINTLSVLNHESFMDASLQTVENIFTLETLNITSELELFEAAEQYAKAMNAKEFTTSSLQLTENGNIQDDVMGAGGVEEKDMKADKTEENETNNNSQAFSSRELNETETGEEQEAGDEELDIRCKSLMKKVVQHIRFLTLTPAELAEYTLTTLLTDAEVLTLIMNAAGNPHRPMPKGFSLSERKRCETKNILMITSTP